MQGGIFCAHPAWRFQTPCRVAGSPAPGSSSLRPETGFLRPPMTSFVTSLRPQACNVQLCNVSWMRTCRNAKHSADTDMRTLLSTLTRHVRRAARTITEAYLSRAVFQQGVIFRVSHRRFISFRTSRSSWGHSQTRRWQSPKRG